MTDPILLVDDDPVQRRLNVAALKKAGYSTLEAGDGLEAMETLRQGANISAILLDLIMPNMDGEAVLAAMAKEGFHQPVIVQTAKGGIDVVVAAMRGGAFDFIVKPVAPDRLIHAMQRALKLEQRTKHSSEGQAPESQTAVPETFKHLNSRNAAMMRAIRLGQKAAASGIPVILEGETGVGKEVFARAIQAASARRKNPFITVNCGAIPENLVESTLFGHEKGSFTGATDKKTGKFIEADTGTLFLDEIGDLPLDAQVKLLRALQEGEVDPIGGKKSVPVDIRIIAATHRNLQEWAQSGQFREDLYFRLNVFPIHIPPLRERREDIAALAKKFIQDFATSENKPELIGITPDALALLERHQWPGNIRELQNTIFRAVVLCDGDALTIEDFPQIAAHTGALAQSLGVPMRQDVDDDHATADMQRWREDQSSALPMAGHTHDAGLAIAFLDQEGMVRSLTDIEREVIEKAIIQCNGQLSEVARRLGIGRSTLYRKFQDHNIDPKAIVQTA